jgi:hypothetical protein
MLCIAFYWLVAWLVVRESGVLDLHPDNRMRSLRFLHCLLFGKSAALVNCPECVRVISQ